MLNTICITALVLLPEEEVCTKTHIHRQAELSVVLGSECQCITEDGIRKPSAFMSLSSGFTVMPSDHEHKNISLQLQVLELLLLTLCGPNQFCEFQKSSLN